MSWRGQTVIMLMIWCTVCGVCSGTRRIDWCLVAFARSVTAVLYQELARHLRCLRWDENYRVSSEG
jgi:hypothetical protein